MVFYIVLGVIIIAISAGLLQFAWIKRKKLRIILTTFPRDIQFIYVFYIRVTLHWFWRLYTNDTIFKSLDKLVKRNPERICFYFQNEGWTYEQVQKVSLQVANYFKKQGYRKGDVIALAMANRPENICIWLGLSRLGVIVSLINTTLRGDFLQHCLSVVKCKGIIIGTEMRPAFAELWEEKWKPGNGRSIPVYELGRYKFNPGNSRQEDANSIPTIDLAKHLQTSSAERIIYQNKNDEPRLLDTLFYICTSGTTGLPKAVKYSHGRLLFVSRKTNILNVNETDVAYCPVPLYHAAGLVAVCWALVDNAPLVIVPKFSASNFWKDINHYKITICIYVGELVRFIVNQPPQTAFESGHTLRAMFGGGGLRPDAWDAFKKRFKVKQFVDIYASTEGNCALINMEGKVGAAGYIPIWLQSIHPIKIVKVDPVNGDIIRDKNTGMAIQCKPNEPGELVGKIIDYLPMTRFDGYSDKMATEAKIERDMFQKGDKYFRTGDILVKDEYGYLYFKDRMGDTFRWKAENVSCVEVEGVISRLTGMRPCVVYGIEVAGTEGRAGMAAISDLDGKLNLNELFIGFQKRLPPFARPVFVRCVRDCKGIIVSGTFKMPKVDLRRQGFDIEKVSDPIYIYTDKGYQLLDDNTYKQIRDGSYRM